MPLVDLIIQDLKKSISDSSGTMPEDTSIIETYWKGVEDATKGAEKYVREIFPGA